ncbi:MAG TPA: response regulator, partial [Vicinamibacteria bacterium]|nr:response regulator [Vicinamibacteria bacterium]
PFVFDRFRQGDAGTTRRHGGLGLGLSIVKQLVELHGGAVSAQSAGLGQGSTFTVSIPVAALRHAGEDARRDLGDDSLALAGLRVLVVDDDTDAREMVSRLLEEQRCTVVAASSTQEALRQLTEQRFDVLLSDIGMPGEDGHALIRRVRALGGAAGAIPAVALTAYTRPEDRLKAMRAGYQVHASKPVEPGALLALVASLARTLPAR